MKLFFFCCHFSPLPPATLESNFKNKLLLISRICRFCTRQIARQQLENVAWCAAPFVLVFQWKSTIKTHWATYIDRVKISNERKWWDSFDPQYRALCSAFCHNFISALYCFVVVCCRAAFLARAFYSRLELLFVNRNCSTTDVLAYMVASRSHRNRRNKFERTSSIANRTQCHRQNGAGMK